MPNVREDKVLSQKVEQLEKLPGLVLRLRIGEGSDRRHGGVAQSAVRTGGRGKGQYKRLLQRRERMGQQSVHRKEASQLAQERAASGGFDGGGTALVLRTAMRRDVASD